MATGAEKTRCWCVLVGALRQIKMREVGASWCSEPKVTGNLKAKLTALFYIKCFVQEVEGKCHLFFSWTENL